MERLDNSLEVIELARQEAVKNPGSMGLDPKHSATIVGCLLRRKGDKP